MDMKKACVTALCVVGGLVCSPNVEALEVKGDASAAVSSSYFWRGKEIADSTVIQPQLSLFVGQWILSVGDTWVAKRESGLSARTRIDAQADYGFTWKTLDLKAGAVARTYHGDPDKLESDAYEIYARAAASDVQFYPSVTLYYSFGDIQGIYASFAAGETWQIQDWLDAVFGVRLGVASAGFIQKFFAGPSAGDDGDTTLRGGLVDLSASLSLPATYKTLIITPRVEYVTLIDSSLRNAAEAVHRKSDGVVGSLAVTWSF
ncbi:MAG: hypothetical protein WCN95_10440 [bacterium]